MVKNILGIMKFKNIILVIVFSLFIIQPTKVESSDIVTDILGTALEQSQKAKLEREKWGITKKDLAGLKSKEIKSLISGNIISSEYNDNLIKGRSEDIFYEDGSYECVISGKRLDNGEKISSKQKGTWSVKQGKICFKDVLTTINNEKYGPDTGCIKILKSKTNPNVYFLRDAGVLYQKFVKIISVKGKIEEERIAKEKKEEKRLAEEEKRVAEEEKKLAEQEKEQEAEEKKLQKKLKLFPQISELEKAQLFLNRVEAFIAIHPAEFDIVEIAEYLNLTKPISENVFEEKQKNDLASFKDYTNSSSLFRDYLDAQHQMVINAQLEEVNSLYSELESAKRMLEMWLSSNLELTIAAKHIKEIKLMLDNPESLNQLEKYNQVVKTYLTSLEEEKSKLDLESGIARTYIERLKEKLKEDMTSDLAPLIIQQVKLLKDAIEKKIIKDLVSVNKQTKDFIYKSWLEAEEKQAEEERKKEEERKAKERKQAEEERKKEEERKAKERKEQEKREAKEREEEKERRAKRVNLNCTYILPQKIQNFTFGYDGKYFFFDGTQMQIGVKDYGPMGEEAEIIQKGKMSFVVDFKQYLPGSKTIPFLSMEIFVDFKRRKSDLIFKTPATGTMDISGQCYLQ